MHVLFTWLIKISKVLGKSIRTHSGKIQVNDNYDSSLFAASRHLQFYKRWEILHENTSFAELRGTLYVCRWHFLQSELMKAFLFVY